MKGNMLNELQTLMNFHSTTSDQGAVSALLDYVEGKLSLKGLHVERLEHEGVHSLYASTNGQKHAKIMLQGHIDVVPGGEEFRQVGDRIYGRGCYDMLFGTASFLALVNSLEDASKYDISLLLTGDEEIGGLNGTKAALDTGGYTCDVCILPDAGDALGTMSTSAKGLFDLRFRANGRSHHGSRPWEGDGAANKLMAFLSELASTFDTTSHNNSTFVVSQLQAGNQALNQGPAEAFAGVDIRYKDVDDFERIRGNINVLMKKYNVDIVFEEVGRNFALNTEAPLVQQFVATYKSHVGTPISFIKAHGSSDARYFDDLNIPVIMYRPDGGNAHGDGEWLSYESWQKFHTILEHYVLDVAKV